MAFPQRRRLRFAYLEHDAEAEAYQGHSYTRVYVEEIGNFPSPAPIMKLMATLRSASGVPVGSRATGNPGGPGHAWVRERLCRSGADRLADRPRRAHRPRARVHPLEGRRQPLSRGRLCSAAEGIWVGGTRAGLAGRRLERGRGRFLRLLADRPACGRSLRHPAPLAALPVDRLGRCQSVQRWLVGGGRENDASHLGRHRP